MLLVTPERATPGCGWRKSQLGSSVWPRRARSCSGKTLLSSPKHTFSDRIKSRAGKSKKHTQWQLRQQSSDLFFHPLAVRCCTVLLANTLGLLNFCTLTKAKCMFVHSTSTGTRTMIITTHCQQFSSEIRSTEMNSPHENGWHHALWIIQSNFIRDVSLP